MAAAAPRALRRIIRHIDEMNVHQHHHNPAIAWQLRVMQRRASVRVLAAARELAAAAEAVDAPPELRALAASVRAGNTTWEQCVAGKADQLPEVRAWQEATEQRSRPVAEQPPAAPPATPRPSARPAQASHPEDDDDDVMRRFLY